LGNNDHIAYCLDGPRRSRPPTGTRTGQPSYWVADDPKGTGTTRSRTSARSSSMRRRRHETLGDAYDSSWSPRVGVDARARGRLRAGENR
jgi:hypothetical protein